MGFLGIGAMEALVILVIALIIFGPGRLPEIMGEAGRTLRDFRRATRELTGDFEDSVSELRQTYDELEHDMRQTARDLKRETESMAEDVNSAVEDATKFDSAPQSTNTRRRTSRPLDQAVDPEEDEEDLSKYFAPGPAAQPPSRPAPKPSKPKRSKPKQPASKAINAREPAPSSNGATSVDDLLAADDGDDLLAGDDY